MKKEKGAKQVFKINHIFPQKSEIDENEYKIFLAKWIESVISEYRLKQHKEV